MAGGATVALDDLVEFGIEVFHAEVVDDACHEVGAVLVDHVIDALRLALGVHQPEQRVHGHRPPGRPCLLDGLPY